MDTLLAERRGPVLLLTINREGVRNALDAATSHALDAELTAAEAEPAIGAVVLTGAGARAFCSGMDLKEAARIGPGHGLVPERGFGGITSRRRTKPLIAAVNGAAWAGGFEIALACDLVLAAEHATFALPEIRHGMFAFAGGIQRLAQRAPRALALSLVLTGEPVSAARLQSAGLVTEVVPGTEVVDRALEVAACIAQADPEAIRSSLELYELSTATDTGTAMRMGMAWGAAALAGAGPTAGIAAYVESREESKVQATRAAAQQAEKPSKS